MEKVNWRIVDKLRRTEAETETGLGRLHGLLRRAWLRADLVIVAESSFWASAAGAGGCCSGNRAACSACSRRRRSYRRGIAQDTDSALDQLQAQTWGVWLHEDADATRYVVLPRGTLEVETWPVDRARAACHAGYRASEGRGMTELETRLMDALKALSTQWNADQQQHVEELDILRARIDDLAQLVTDYAAQHEQHAAALAQHATALQAQQQHARHASGGLDRAVRTHHQGLQDARRLVEAGKNRIEQRIEQTRDPGPSR